MPPVTGSSLDPLQGKNTGYKNRMTYSSSCMSRKKAVSGKFNFIATDCISSSVSSELTMQTPAGLPLNITSVKESMR